MGLSKEERKKVSEQLTKIATFLERKRKEVQGEDENLTPYDLFRRLKTEKKAVGVPAEIEELAAEAPSKEVSQARKDVRKVQKEVEEMMPALERLDTRLRDKLKLPASSSHMQALDGLAKSLVQVSTKLEGLENIGKD